MGTPGKASKSVRIATIVVAVMLLTSCSPTAAEVVASNPPVASTATSSTPSATVEPTEPVAEAPTCVTALTEDAYTDFETSGLALRDYQGWRTDIQFMADDGGIACAWQGQGDVVVIFGQLPLTSTEWETKRTELVATGYVEETDPVAGYFNEPDTDPNYIDGGFVYRDGNLFYVSYPAVTQWIPALVSA